MTPAEKNAHISMLLHKLQLMPQKASIVGGISFGRTESIRELTEDEKDDLVNYLHEEQRNRNEVNNGDNRMRRKIISKAHELHWHLPGTQKADMDRINNWCIKYGPFKKRLNLHSSKELPILVTAFENMYRSVISKI